jgi:predicted deacetylase
VSKTAIVSVHDVMPSTFSRVERILAVLEKVGVPPASLLVVPGKDWSLDGIAALRSLANLGHPLAGHGWIHKATSGSRSLYHRVHSLLISRNEAEHLSLPPEDLADLVRQCHEWFPGVGLPTPDLYVPPAWALGSLTTDHLRELPFRWYEVLRGYLDVQKGERRWLPLVGFEADTSFRQWSLRLWNQLNALLATGGVGPLRISIHPDDLDLLLSKDIRIMLQDGWTFISEADYLEGAVGEEKA